MGLIDVLLWPAISVPGLKSFSWYFLQKHIRTLPMKDVPPAPIFSEQGQYTELDPPPDAPDHLIAGRADNVDLKKFWIYMLDNPPEGADITKWHLMIKQFITGFEGDNEAHRSIAVFGRIACKPGVWPWPEGVRPYLRDTVAIQLADGVAIVVGLPDSGLTIVPSTIVQIFASGSSFDETINKLKQTAPADPAAKQLFTDECDLLSRAVQSAGGDPTAAMSPSFPTRVMLGMPPARRVGLDSLARASAPPGSGGEVDLSSYGVAIARIWKEICIRRYKFAYSADHLKTPVMCLGRNMFVSAAWIAACNCSDKTPANKTLAAACKAALKYRDDEDDTFVDDILNNDQEEEFAFLAFLGGERIGALLQQREDLLDHIEARLKISDLLTRLAILTVDGNLVFFASSYTERARMEYENSIENVNFDRGSGQTENYSPAKLSQATMSIATSAPIEMILRYRPLPSQRKGIITNQDMPNIDMTSQEYVKSKLAAITIMNQDMADLRDTVKGVYRFHGSSACTHKRAKPTAATSEEKANETDEEEPSPKNDDSYREEADGFIHSPDNAKDHMHNIDLLIDELLKDNDVSDSAIQSWDELKDGMTSASKELCDFMYNKIKTQDPQARAELQMLAASLAAADTEMARGDPPPILATLMRICEASFAVIATMCRAHSSYGWRYSSYPVQDGEFYADTPNIGPIIAVATGYRVAWVAYHKLRKVAADAAHKGLVQVTMSSAIKAMRSYLNNAESMYHGRINHAPSVAQARDCTFYGAPALTSDESTWLTARNDSVVPPPDLMKKVSYCLSSFDTDTASNRNFNFENPVHIKTALWLGGVLAGTGLSSSTYAAYTVTNPPLPRDVIVASLQAWIISVWCVYKDKSPIMQEQRGGTKNQQPSPIFRRWLATMTTTLSVAEIMGPTPEYKRYEAMRMYVPDTDLRLPQALDLIYALMNSSNGYLKDLATRCCAQTTAMSVILEAFASKDMVMLCCLKYPQQIPHVVKAIEAAKAIILKTQRLHDPKSSLSIKEFRQVACVCSIWCKVNGKIVGYRTPSATWNSLTLRERKEWEVVCKKTGTGSTNLLDLYAAMTLMKSTLAPEALQALVKTAREKDTPLHDMVDLVGRMNLDLTDSEVVKKVKEMEAEVTQAEIAEKQSRASAAYGLAAAQAMAPGADAYGQAPYGAAPFGMQMPSDAYYDASY